MFTSGDSYCYLPPYGIPLFVTFIVCWVPVYVRSKRPNIRAWQGLLISRWFLFLAFFATSIGSSSAFATILSYYLNNVEKIEPDEKFPYFMHRQYALWAFSHVLIWTAIAGSIINKHTGSEASASVHAVASAPAQEKKTSDREKSQSPSLNRKTNLYSSTSKPSPAESQDLTRPINAVRQGQSNVSSWVPVNHLYTRISAAINWVIRSTIILVRSNKGLYTLATLLAIAVCMAVRSQAGANNVCYQKNIEPITDWTIILLIAGLVLSNYIAEHLASFLQSDWVRGRLSTFGQLSVHLTAAMTSLMALPDIWKSQNTTPVGRMAWLEIGAWCLYMTAMLLASMFHAEGLM